jgi:hypothetical protein
MYSSKTILAIVAGVVAYLVYKHPDFVAVLLPKYVDAYFIRARFSNRDRKNTGATRVPLITRVVPQSISIENIKDMLGPAGYPIHVKNAIKVDQDRHIALLIEKNKGRSMRMLNYENYTDPHLSPSCGDYSFPNMVPFDDYANSHLTSANVANHSYLYAGFESITDADVIDELLGIDIKSVGDYRLNNLFTSNFPHTLMSASMHCAPIDSLTFQLMGTKTWYFISPDELASIQNIPMPTCFNVPMTDDELLSKIKNLVIIKQGPGDAMYFGPHWCHAVVTDAGPNLMFNMRYNALPKIKKGPLSLFFKLLVRSYTRTMGGRPQDNKENYPLIYEDLTNYFHSCGPSTAFNKIIEAGYALVA